MKKRLYFAVNCLLILLLFFSCTVTPEEDIKETLNPIQNSIDIPYELEISNFHDQNQIYLSWEPVQGATFYKIEYQSALDYISGNPLKTLIVNSTEYYFEIPEDSKTDKRYIFRVKAGFKTSAGDIKESSATEFKEGVVLDSLSVSSFVEDNTVTFYPSYSKVKSILNKGNIVEPTVEYYEGNFLNSELDSRFKLNSEKAEIGSSEKREFTAVLLADNEVVKKTLVTVTTDTDYIPRSLYSLSAQNNLYDHIVLNWESYDINSGINSNDFEDDNNYELVFKINRKKSNEIKYSPLKDENGILLLKASDLSEEYKNGINSEIVYPTWSFSFSDYSVVPNQEYDYQVVSCYYREKDGVLIEETNNKRKAVLNTYIADRAPLSFIVNAKNFDSLDNSVTLGVRSINIPLSWSFEHELPSSYKIKIERRLVFSSLLDLVFEDDELDHSEKEFILEPNEKGFSDIITISSFDFDTYQFQYVISILREDENDELVTTSGNKMEAKFETGESVLVTASNGITIDFLHNSLSVTGAQDNSSLKPLSKSILLTWEYGEVEYSDVDELDNEFSLFNENLFINIFRSNGDENYYQIAKVPYLENSKVNYSYLDKNLEDGVSYTYRINPSYERLESPFSRSYQSINPKTGRTLEAVSSISADLNQSSEKINVFWTEVDNVSSYRLIVKGIEGNTYNDSFIVFTPSFVFDKDSDPALFGKAYIFSVVAIDENGDETSESFSSEGRTFGVPKLNIESEAKEIKVSWSPIEGADRYRLFVYADKDAKELISEEIFNKTQELSYTFSCDNPDLINYASKKENQPYYYLSQPYYFSLIPLFGLETPHESLIERKDGSWVLSPTNIKADKAVETTTLFITFDSVEDASEYVLYKKNDLTAPWTFVGNYTATLNSSIQTIKLIDVDKTPSYYSVSAIKKLSGNRLLEGPIQESFIPSSDGYYENYGTILVSPTSCSIEFVDTNLVRLRFNRVFGANEYQIIIDDGKEVSVHRFSNDSIENAIKNPTNEIKENVISVTGDLVSCYVKVNEFTTKLKIDAFFSAVNTNGYYGVNTKSSSVVKSAIYSMLTNEQRINLVTYALEKVIYYAGQEFDSSSYGWWSLTGGKTFTDETGKAKMTNAVGGAFSSVTKQPVLTLTDYEYNGFTLKTESTTEVRIKTIASIARPEVYPQPNRINGTIYVYGVSRLNPYRVKFNEFYFDKSSGSIVFEELDPVTESIISTVTYNSSNWSNVKKLEPNGD